MSLRVIVRAEAEQDILRAYAWYEEQVRGLGSDFVTALDETLSLVAREPEIFQRVHRTVRRALLHRFPYGVFYVVESRRVVVLAVMHTARHPSKWTKRGR